MVNKLDPTNLAKMIDEKYISVQQHPTLGLFIHNYTQKAQFDRVWNNETLQCRGLITDHTGRVVARPFPKFFNLSEHLQNGGQLPAEDFVVTEKMDGSLGILYWDNQEPQIATRGSFTSDQAIKGTEMLKTKYPNLELNRDWTALFEIIYPANRIVVDYADMEDLVLLSIIDTLTAEELAYSQIKEIATVWGMPVVKKYDAIRDFTSVEARPNAEGYVIALPSSGQRFKIKFDEYVRLHRLVTGVNSKTIWELLRNNQPFEELLEKVPDEFYAWVKSTRDSLIGEHKKWRETAMEVYSRAIQMETRKEQAIFLQQFNCRSIVFKMLDQQPYDEIIWKMVRPKAEKPFKEEI